MNFFKLWRRETVLATFICLKLIWQFELLEKPENTLRAGFLKPNADIDE